MRKGWGVVPSDLAGVTCDAATVTTLSRQWCVLGGLVLFAVLLLACSDHESAGSQATEPQVVAPTAAVTRSIATPSAIAAPTPTPVATFTTTAHSGSRTIGEQGTAIRDIDFLNGFSYPHWFGGDDLVVNEGRAQVGALGDNDYWLTIVGDVVYGDVTGDGHEEAAVWLTHTGGGSGVYSTVRVYALASDEPLDVRSIGSAGGGDRAYNGVLSVAMADGELLVYNFVGSSAACCADAVRLTRWDVRDGELEATSVGPYLPYVDLTPRRPNAKLAIETWTPSAVVSIPPATEQGRFSFDVRAGQQVSLSSLGMPLAEPVEFTDEADGAPVASLALGEWFVVERDGTLVGSYGSAKDGTRIAGFLVSVDHEDREPELVYSMAQFFAIGSAVAITPDGSGLLVTDVQPTGERGCEAGVEYVFRRVPFDGTPSTIIADHSINSAGIDGFQVHGDTAAWLEWCDGYVRGPFLADISGDGELTNISELAPLLNDIAAGGGISNLRWESADVLVVTVHQAHQAGTAIEVAINVTTEEILDQVTLPSSQDSSGQWGRTHPIPIEDGFGFVTPNGTEVVMHGLPKTTIFRGPVLVDDEESFLYVSVLADHPSWTNVLRFPLTERAASQPAVFTEFTGNQIANDGYRERGDETYLGIVANNSAWLIQQAPEDESCTAPLTIVPRDGSVSRSLHPIGLVSTSVLRDGTLVYQAGCQRGAQYVGTVGVDGDGYTDELRTFASTAFAWPWYFNDFRISDEQLVLLRTGGQGSAVSIDRAGGAVRTDSEYGLQLREPRLEFQLDMLEGWTATTPGGGTGGIMLTHESGALVIAVGAEEPTIRFLEVDPTSFPGSTSHPIVVPSYQVGSYRGSELPEVLGTRWDIARTVYFEPGLAHVIATEADRGWLVLAASVPETVPPDVAAQVDALLASFRIGVESPSN